MKALAIVALVITGISFIIPVYGVFISLGTSFLAVISFRSEAVLSGITVGLNLVKTAFFSLSIGAAVLAAELTEPGSGSMIYWGYVGFHVVALVLGIVLAMTKKKDTV